MTRMLTRSRNASRLNCSPSKQNQFSSISDDNDELDNICHLVQKTPTKKRLQTENLDLNQLSPVTPPKQSKNNTNVLNTPSTLFQGLSLTSPPKCTKKTKSASRNRKSLFNKNRNRKNKACSDSEDDGDCHVLSKENSDYLHGHRDSDSTNLELNKNVTECVYVCAKKALHNSAPESMPGREKELYKLRTFINEHITNKLSGSLYVSGPPGTGKTASLNLILQEHDITTKLKKVYVNCTAIKSANSVYARIAKELDIKTNVKSEKDYLTVIKNYFAKSNKMAIIVLDEIDQLKCKNQSILYTIFEWPAVYQSQILLIGIANALDLTDRILPRLQAHCELKPELMHFAPYTREQIMQILSDRLKNAGALEVFSPPALQMLAGKVAAVSGDLRRALDIGRRVVELVEQGRKEDTLKSLENIADNEFDEKVKSVELKQVVDVLNSIYGTSQNLCEDDDDAFPLQQKIIVCSILLMRKKAKNKDITIGKLHDVYRKICSKRNISDVDQAEFVGLCSLIESRGIIKISGKKEPRLHKITLQWDEEEIASALKDKQLISVILQDESCLGKY